MIPNTVEGVELVRRRDEAQTLDYGVAYLWGFKARDSSYFVPFSDALGVTEDRGVVVAGAKIVPAGADARRHRLHHPRHAQHRVRRARLDPAAACLRRAVPLQHQLHRPAHHRGGSDARGAVRDRAGLGPRCRELPRCYHPRGHLGERQGGDLNGPFGSFPAYTVLDQLNFNNAGETTVVVGAAYDFSHIVTDGLKFQARYGRA